MRMRRRVLSVGIVLALVWFGSIAAQEQQPIESPGAEWKALFDAGAFEELAGELYTDDAIYLSGDRTVAEGREAVRSILEGYREAGLVSVDTEVVRSERSQEWAYEFGRYAFQIEDGATVADGDYMMLLRQEQGQWRIFVHMARPAAPVEVEEGD